MTWRIVPLVDLFSRGAAIAITPRALFMNFDPAEQSFILAGFHCQLPSNFREFKVRAYKFYETSFIGKAGKDWPACGNFTPMTP
jgi:hypothetical protein